MSSQCCILLVDDEAMNRDALSRRLVRQGHHVILADSGTRALHLLKKHDFDLVLLDVMMPDVDGLEVLATIRETNSHTDLPVIMVTARDQGGDVVAALQMGANDYVTKPINFPVLLARIQTQLQIRQSLLPKIEAPSTPAIGLPAVPAPLPVNVTPPPGLSLIHDTSALNTMAAIPGVLEPPHIPGYELLQLLGKGGMGTVFKARHVRMDRVVALKVLDPDRFQRPEEVQQFLKEVRALAQMSHPNVVVAYDAGEVNNTHYAAMEYVDGPDLEKLVREKGPLPVDEASHYIRQAAQGLQHAFERGYVHRDIKPSNLLVLSTPPTFTPVNESKFTPQLSGVFRRSRGGVVKILDLGLALFKPAATLPGGGNAQRRALGTPDYMAPEQWKDAHDVDIRADLYSLGCTFYYLLTGSVPFPGGAVMEKMLKHSIEEPAPLDKFRNALPSSVVAIIKRLLAKRAADRYQTPDQLVQQL